MGGSSPNSDYYFLGWIFLFFFVFRVVFMFPKNKYQLDRGVGGRLGSGQSEFFSDFWIVFKLTRPLNNVMQ